MSILRPILIPVLHPLVTPLPLIGQTTEETLLYLLGMNGQLTQIDGEAQDGTVISISDFGGAVLLETTDGMVVSETGQTVTLEFGD